MCSCSPFFRGVRNLDVLGNRLDTIIAQLNNLLDYFTHVGFPGNQINAIAMLSITLPTSNVDCSQCAAPLVVLIAPHHENKFRHQTLTQDFPSVVLDITVPITSATSLF